MEGIRNQETGGRTAEDRGQMTEVRKNNHSSLHVLSEFILSRIEVVERVEGTYPWHKLLRFIRRGGIHRNALTDRVERRVMP